MRLTPKNESIVVGVLLGCIFFINFFSLIKMTLTYDEPSHFHYGMNILKGQTERALLGETGDSKMPISVLNAWIPFFIEKFSKQSPDFYETDDGRRERGFDWRIMARLSTVAFSMLLALIVYKWSKELYGSLGGLFSLFLFTFSPNIIAHSQVVTTDLFFVFFSTLTFYCFWLQHKQPSPALVWKTSAFAGVAQVAKYSAVFLYPIMALTKLLACLPKLKTMARPNRINEIKRGLWMAIKMGLILLVTAVVIINIGFLFTKSLDPLSAYKFRSDILLFLQQKLGALAHWPTFLPAPYLDGFDWVRSKERWVDSSAIGHTYLMGRLTVGNIPGYYFVAYLFKEPIAYQIFLATAVYLFIKNWKKFSFFNNEVFLFVPIIFFTIYLNFFFNAQIGIRYLLIIYPLLYVFCGNLFFEGAASLNKPTVVAIGSLCLYALISVFSYFPHFIPYFNELVWDRKMAYKILADSNLNWGQGEAYLDRYMKDHPEAQYFKLIPRNGKIVVDVNMLLGVMPAPELDWLRENYKPVGHIAYEYLIFEVPAQGTNVP